MPIVATILSTIGGAFVSKTLAPVFSERIHASDIKAVTQGTKEIATYIKSVNNEAEALAVRKLPSISTYYLLPLVALLVPLSIYLITKK